MALCTKAQRTTGYRCTLDADHTGPHIATHNGGQFLASWPDSRAVGTYTVHVTPEVDKVIAAGDIIASTLEGIVHELRSGIADLRRLTDTDEVA